MLPPKAFALLEPVLQTCNYIYTRYVSPSYRGNALKCSCCGLRAGRFMDWVFVEGVFNRKRYTSPESVLCPYCGSAPRHRVICQWLADNKDALGSSPRILMWAAESNIKRWLRKQGFRYTTADLMDTFADVRADIQNSPFADGSWDFITCNHVLEHVPDFRAALRELRRILAKDGILEITAPTDYRFTTTYEDPSIVAEAERIEHFGQHDHLRVFGSDFKQQIEQCGFRVEVVCGDDMPAEIRAITGAFDYDDNRAYICRKA